MHYIYAISKFDLAQDMEPYLDDTGKELQPIIIGEERIPNSEPTPIVEYVYTDVIQDALNGDLSIAPFGGLTPPILFYNKQGIVPHNDSLALFAEEIEKSLKTVPYEIKIDAMKELAALYIDKSIGKVMTIRKNSVTNTLVNLVSANCSTKFNNLLIVEMLKKEMKESDTGSPISKKLAGLDKRALISLFGDCKELKKSQSTRNPELKKLISEYDPEIVINAVAWEFTDRCFNQERCQDQ